MDGCPFSCMIKLKKKTPKERSVLEFATYYCGRVFSFEGWKSWFQFPWLIEGLILGTCFLKIGQDSQFYLCWEQLEPELELEPKLRILNEKGGKKFKGLTRY